MTAVMLHDHAPTPRGVGTPETPGRLIKFQAPEMVFGAGSLADGDLVATVWSGVTPNPKDHEIRASYARYRESGRDVLIAMRDVGAAQLGGRFRSRGPGAGKV